MIYLLGLFFQWIVRALVPAFLFLATGALLVVLVWVFFLRRRRRAVVAIWLMLGLATLSFAGWRTWDVWRDFKHPELRMFRHYIADPIPNEVRNLTMATPAPALFHDGALIKFQVPETVLRKILDHSLPGSKTLALVEEIKRQSRNDSANRAVIVGPDGRSHKRVELDQFPEDGPSAFRGVRGEVEAADREGPREVHALLFEGEWGKLQSVIVFDRAAATVVIKQHLERRRNPKP